MIDDDLIFTSSDFERRELRKQRTVLLTGDQYAISSPIVLYSGVRLLGSGHGVILKEHAPFYLLLIKEYIF